LGRTVGHSARPIQHHERAAAAGPAQARPLGRLFLRPADADQVAAEKDTAAPVARHFRDHLRSNRGIFTTPWKYRRGVNTLNDLTDQDKPGTAVNRHALVYYEKGILSIADTKTPNGTYLNKVRIAPGKKFGLKAEDQIQIGNTILQVKVIVKKKTGAQK